MSARNARVLVVLFVAAHLSLLLAYTLPRAFVPDRVFFWSQRYARPLFYQQWNLFAPDPRPCDLRVEVELPDGTWRPLTSADDNYVYRRMARPLSGLVAADVEQGDTVLMPRLSAILRSMARGTGGERAGSRFRLVQRCIADPARPLERVGTTVELHLSKP
ncbi:MAG: hypothetical protein KF797_12015 [Flavobacteriales bacterium]|nr:hypothetical protein [Flavobacteriales bacterium]